jgi:hypothetical protein
MYRANENALLLNMKLLTVSGYAYWADFGKSLSHLSSHQQTGRLIRFFHDQT